MPRQTFDTRHAMPILPFFRRCSLSAMLAPQRYADMLRRYIRCDIS